MVNIWLVLTLPMYFFPRCEFPELAFLQWMVTISRTEYFLLGFVPFYLFSLFLFCFSSFFSLFFSSSDFDVSFSIPTFSSLRQTYTQIKSTVVKTTFLLSQLMVQVTVNATKGMETSTVVVEIGPPPHGSLMVPHSRKSQHPNLRRAV